MANSIGLNPQKTQELNKKLNHLLANYQVYYQNLRGLHWNIKGERFFELHEKFEEYYNDAVVKIDEIAERILTLEGEPLHTLNSYVNEAKIEQEQSVTDGKKGIAIVASNLSTLVTIERDILTIAGTADDEGTASLMSDYISETEKTLWMLNAYLK